MNTTELVTFEKGEALTTSLILADGVQVSHENMIKLIRKHQSDLEEFGTFRFQIQKSGGRPTEYALLNEQQATLILTYMKNTDIVRQFKKALVRAFFELRDIVRDGISDKRIDVNLNHTRGITNIHGLDIKYTLDLTKIIQRPTKMGLALLERLTGVSLEDIADAPGEDTQSGVFQDFLHECCIVAPSIRIPFRLIYERYSDWCHFNNRVVPSKRWLSDQLRLGEFTRDSVGGQTHFTGIGLK